MAKQKGPIKYIGTLGDIRHFKNKNTEGYFAGMIGGPSAEQIKTDPAFARTRENMSEFGGSANVAKVVRTSRIFYCAFVKLPVWVAVGFMIY